MLEYLSNDDLPESIKDLADVIGIDSLKKLIKFAVVVACIFQMKIVLLSLLEIGS